MDGSAVQACSSKKRLKSSACSTYSRLAYDVVTGVVRSAGCRVQRAACSVCSSSKEGEGVGVAGD